MINDIEMIEFLKRQLSENTDGKTKTNVIIKIKKYIERIIDKQMEEKEKEIQNSGKKELDIYNKDILDIINETSNINIIINTIDLIIKKHTNTNKIIPELNNKNNLKENCIESQDKNINQDNLKKKNKRIFNDTNINYTGDFNKEVIKRNKKIKTIYNFCYDEDNILTRFIFKNKSKNFEFYYCFKLANECLAKAKLDIKMNL